MYRMLSRLCLLSVVLLLSCAPVWAQAPTPRAKKKLSQHLSQWFGQIKTRIKALQMAIVKAPKSKRFGLLMKLAKEYEQVIRIHHLLIRRYSTYRGSTVWAKISKLKREAQRQSILFRIEAAKLYQQLLTTYAGDARLCPVYHGLARHLYRLNKRQLAYHIYRSMLAAFASRPCPNKAHAYLALGEQLAQKRQHKKAIALFLKATQQGQTQAQAFALYKLGVSHYQLMGYVKAMGYFVDALKYLKTAPKAIRPRDVEGLQRRIRHQLVLASSHVARPKSARELFRKVEPFHARDMENLLANVYRTQGKFAYASDMYESFIKTASIGSRALGYLRRSVAMSAKVHPDKVVLGKASRIKALLKKFASVRTSSAFRTEALALHAAWVKFGMIRQKARKFRQALSWYRLSGVLLLPKQGSEMFFWQGEARMALKEFAAAAESYGRYVREIPKGKHVKAASYNVVLARERALLAAKSPQQRKLLMSLTWEACRAFLRRSPNGPRAALVRYRYLHYAQLADRIPLVMKLFGELVAFHRTHPVTSRAGNAVIALLRRHKRWKTLAGWARKLQHGPTLNPATRSQLQRLEFSARVAACFDAKKPTSQAVSRPTKAASRPASQPSSKPASRPSRSVMRRQALCLEGVAKAMAAVPALADVARKRAAQLRKAAGQ